MDRAELLKIFDREQRIEFQFPGVKKEITFLTVDASPMSRPILEKHGFQFLGFSTPCVWMPEN